MEIFAAAGTSCPGRTARGARLLLLILVLVVALEEGTPAWHVY
jgi:hypothetical protein